MNKNKTKLLPHRNSLIALGSDAKGTWTLGLAGPRSDLKSPRLGLQPRTYFVARRRAPSGATRSSGWSQPSRRVARSPKAGAEGDAWCLRLPCPRCIGEGGRRKAEEQEEEHDGEPSSLKFGDADDIFFFSTEKKRCEKRKKNSKTCSACLQPSPSPSVSRVSSLIHVFVVTSFCITPSVCSCSFCCCCCYPSSSS